MTYAAILMTVMMKMEVGWSRASQLRSQDSRAGLFLGPSDLPQTIEIWDFLRR